MFNTWNKYPFILYISLWHIFAIGKLDAQSQASAVAVAVSQAQVPPPPNPVVEALAQSISEGLQNSPVLGDFANFVIYHPYEIFSKFGTILLARSGIDNPALIQYVADVVEKVGVVTSQVYFGAAGYTMAKVLFDQGIATMDNVDALSLMCSSVVGVIACTDGLTDTESVMNAVVSGLFEILNAYKLINSDNMVYIFYLYAEEIKAMSGVN